MSITINYQQKELDITVATYTTLDAVGIDMQDGRGKATVEVIIQKKKVEHDRKEKKP